MEGNTDTTAHRQAAAIARIAWFVTFVLPLVLAALLFGMKSAQAAPPVPALTPLAFEEELEDEVEEEGEFEVEACEIVEEEFEEEELDEATVEAVCDEAEGEDKKKAGDSGSVAPEECILRSIHARAVTSPKHSLKLTVGYTTYEPVSTTIEIRVGSTRIGAVHRRLGRSGVLRIVKNLSDGKVPKRLTVHLDIPRSPSYCGKYETERVRVR